MRDFIVTVIVFGITAFFVEVMYTWINKKVHNRKSNLENVESPLGYIVVNIAFCLFNFNNLGVYKFVAAVIGTLSGSYISYEVLRRWFEYEIIRSQLEDEFKE